MYVASLHLENWKNFKSVDVKIGRRAFLVGPNASGKSNLLDSLRFLHDIAQVGGGFQYAVRKRTSVSAIRSLSATRYPSVVIRVTLARRMEDTSWTYELQFSQDNNRIPFVVSEQVFKDDKQLLDRPDEPDRSDPERLRQTALEQVNANSKFREIVEVLRSIRYLHVVPQLIREPDRSIGKTNDPYGGDFLEILARTPKRTLESRLERIRRALQIAIPQIQLLELKRDDSNGTPHLRGNYKHWREKGAWQTEDQFSDGTLRLIGLLWAILDGQGPLLLEEPELSLHSAVVKLLPQLIYRMQSKNDRQVILSTHASEMFIDSGVMLSEVLVLDPTPQGSRVRRGVDVRELTSILEAGDSLSEGIIPLTAPKDIAQLPLFSV